LWRSTTEHGRGTVMDSAHYTPPRIDCGPHGLGGKWLPEKVSDESDAYIPRALHKVGDLKLNR